MIWNLIKMEWWIGWYCFGLGYVVGFIIWVFEGVRKVIYKVNCYSWKLIFFVFFCSIYDIKGDVNKWFFD